MFENAGMKPQLGRRDFLKWASLLPFLGVKWPGLVDQPRGFSRDSQAPNVLILVFDTLSARHVSLYGYQRETTPNLARFAERATVYHAHSAGGNFTSPGTASLLTGTYPWSHRAFHIQGTMSRLFEARNIFSLFGSKGYYRIAYTHNQAADALLYQLRQHLDERKEPRELSVLFHPVPDRLFPNDYNVARTAEAQFLRGGIGEDLWPSSLFLAWFYNTLWGQRAWSVKQKLADAFPRGAPDYNSQERSGLILLLEDAIDWLQTQVSRLPRPYLAYIHLFPPHAPYATRREFIDIFDDGWAPLPKPRLFFDQEASEEHLNLQRRLYDETIAYVDAEFGRLYDDLQKTGALENTCLVFTSDHGEMFERGIIGHVTPALYHPLVHVPLLISRPGQAVREEVYTPTSAVDVLPTLLHVTGQPIPEWCEGEVLPPFGEGAAKSERGIFTVEAKENPKQGPLTKGTVSLRRGRYQLIHYFGYLGVEREFELYDLENDPEERENLYSPNNPLAVELQKALEEKLQEMNRPYLA